MIVGLARPLEFIRAPLNTDLFEIFIHHEPSFRDSAHSTRPMGERPGRRRGSHDG